MTVNQFPASPLTITVELLINGTWHDISTYVYQRDGIQIAGGSQDQSSSPQPATLNLTLNNRDGRFSPNYISGAYYPYLVRNTQIRLSITAFSSTGVYYSGYRFWGEVPDWPPLSDTSATDIYIQIQASGPLRRVNQGGGEGSALTRYYNSLTGGNVPVAYWPCEEDTSATTIGAGIEGGTDMSVTSVAKPVWKSNNSFNGSGPVPIVNSSTWDGLTGSFGSSGNDVFNTPGNFTWIASTSTVDARVWGAGGGADNGFRGSGGGAGEFARGTAVAVTAGNVYNLTVGAGGAGGVTFTNSDRPGSPGGSSSFTGDSVTITANGGGRGTGSNSGGGAGGTGSGAPINFDGGAGASNPSDFSPGSGGGGAAGTSGAGGAGSTATSGNVGAGGTAGTGGGKGGSGGKVGSVGNPGGTPGGGGGGGSTKGSGPFTNYAGGGGAGGQVQLVYTPATQPTTNVIRWIQQAPVHGGNPGKVLLRANTSGTAIARLDVTYVAGGKMRLQGYDQNLTQKFDSTAQTWSVDGQPVMGSVELQNSGSNVVWSFKTITPGSTTLLGSVSGTVTSASVGNVSEVLVSPNGDITQTAMGHISVQYALVPLTNVSKALDGNTSELSIDRFIRLGNEQALDNIPVWKEASDHWGFESSAAANFLTGNNATFDSGVGNWTNGILQGGNGSCTTTSVTTVAHTGAGCMSVTATSNGSMTTTMCQVSNLGSQGLACSPGDVVTASAWVLADADPEACNVGIGFFNSSNTFISGSLGTTVYDTTNKWMQATQTLTAPANTTHARMNVLFNGVATSEVHYVDDAYIADVSTGAQQSWAGITSNLSVQNTTASGWPSEGSYSLQLSASGSANPWGARSPTGTSSTLFVTPGDIVSAAADVYAPSALGSVTTNLYFYNASGSLLSTVKSATTSVAAGAVSTINVTTGGSGAPASASTFSVGVVDNEINASGTIYVDNVRVGSRMGTQTRKRYCEFLEEIKDLDQGIMKEAKDLWGLKHRTRIQMFNQTPAVTLDYNQQELSEVPAPVIDDTNTANNVIVHRHKGSKVQVSLNQGTMSVLEPPGGTGRYKRTIKAIAELDEQLLNLANHLLTLGTVTDERYPILSVALHRTEVANLFAAIAGVEIGDFVEVINLPFWYPNTTAKQLVIGYSENITPFTWDISWNCTPESPWEITATTLRRW